MMASATREKGSGGRNNSEKVQSNKGLARKAHGDSERKKSE